MLAPKTHRFWSPSGSWILPPDQHTPLRASFPGVYNFSKASFDVEGFALRSYAGAAATPTKP